MLVVIAAIVGAVTTAVAYFVPWLPEQASEQRNGIDFIFWLTTAICISIFALVAAVTIYAAYKFRVRPDDDSDGPPIHGHTGIEIAWTAIPALLVIIIGTASGIVLARNDRAVADSLRIKVTAQQFAWNFEYPNGVTSGTLRLPLHRDAVLELRARDVIHSFWVPQFGQKQDAVPGTVTRLAITPTKVGSYPVICTELCGLGHSVMRTQALVMPQREYDTWLRRQGKELAGPPGQAGAAVFKNQGCGSCHTFKPAGSTAKVGPNLDELAGSAEKAGKPLEQFVRESIVEPNAYVHPGFPKNVMPKTFAQLPDDQLDALVQYLVKGNR
jgi:cytochrome c oxidase subunit II